MAAQNLQVDDELCAEGSWGFTYATITAIEGDVAIGTNGIRFRLPFTDGDASIREADAPTSMESVSSWRWQIKRN